MQRLHWPDLGEYTEVAEALSAAIKSDRGDVNPTVDDEEGLRETVERHLDLMQGSPARYGVSGVVVGRLAEPEYRRDVTSAGMARVSALWPLSLLIYLVPHIEEISCFGATEWSVTLEGHHAELDPASCPFRDERDVINLFQKVVSMDGITGDSQFNEAQPTAECHVGAEMRLSCQMYPVVSTGKKVQGVLRLSKIGEMYDLGQYVQDQAFPSTIADVLRVLIDRRVDILLAGGTGTGKTTLLRVMCGYIPDDQRVCVIEDGAELHLEEESRTVEVNGTRGKRSWVRAVFGLSTIPSARREQRDLVSMGDLVKAALRLSPDRIMLGEARGAEAYECLEAMNTGHEGSLMTVHADSALRAVERMRTLVMKHEDVRGSHALADEIVRSALEVVVHLRKLDTGQRVLSGIAMVNEKGAPQPIYELDDDGILRRKIKSAQESFRLWPKLRGAFPMDEWPEV